MKKSLVATSAILALGSIALAACGGSSSKAADVFIYQFSDTYIGTVRSALKTDLEGVSITPNFYDAAGVQATQTQQIETAISDGSKLLVVNAVEQKAAGLSIAQKAKAASTPVIFFNREVDDAAVQAYDKACFVGTDPDQAGYMQGDIIADALIKDGQLNTLWDKNGDGVIKYVMLRADLDNAEANGRTKYSVQEANTKLKAAGLKELVQLGVDTNCGWDKAKAKEALDSMITTYGVAGDGIEMVIANNDDMALGAVQSLAANGYNDGKSGKNVLVTGVDATSAAQTAIKAGTMYGSVKQDAEAMAKCIAALSANVLDGKDYLAGTTYTWQASDVHKIRIPYAKYVG
ncbi:MAG: D-galactose-binding periplasmic protein precursor [Tenericutes bacterium ADurb.BinA155]|nr:MAG: D-galactose-binding periplasmic protein precursor [Tenericutes bacterium ADurb.BinA155]